MVAPCGHPLAWTGLYRKDYDLATPESMAHPAKASWDLAFKILDHLKELGLLQEGATVLDPMAGTGRFLLAACAKGYKAIAVELEPKFIKMLEDNKAYASKKLCLPGFELPLTIIQGDARNLSQLLQERGLVGIGDTLRKYSYYDIMKAGGGHESPQKVRCDKRQKPISNQYPPQVRVGDGLPQSSIGGALSRPKHEPERNGYAIRDKSEPSECLTKEEGNPVSPSGVSRPNQKEKLQGRESESPLALPDRERVVKQGEMSDMRERGKAGNTPQGFRPFQQQPEQSSSALCPLPSESPQNSQSQRDKEQRADRLGTSPQSHFVILTSPPYGQGVAPDWTVSYEKAHNSNYGSTPGQIGRLPDKPIAITSPPYANTTDRGKQDNGFLAQAGEKHHRLYTPASFKEEGYGSTPGQIGALPDRPFTAITSPPYENAQKGGGISARMRDEGNYPLTTALPGSLYQPSEAGQTKGQIGQEQGQTYLEAMALVYAEIAKVADVLVCVVKNPTRNGKLRRLDLDTIALLEATGWKLHCRHRSTLFEEQEMGHLFEGQVKKPRGRLSFFKRLSYQKGSPVAQWEDVLVAVKRESPGQIGKLRDR